MICDIAIIGGGVSGAMTLVHIVERLKVQRAHRDGSRSENADAVPRMLILDRHGDFGAGLAYGSRSGRIPLLLTPAEAAVPESHRESFFSFLHMTESLWIDELREQAAGRDWYARNKKAVDAGEISEIVFPRFLVGRYIRSIFDEALMTARRDNLAEIRVVAGNVQKLERLHVAEAQRTELHELHDEVLSEATNARKSESERDAHGRFRLTFSLIEKSGSESQSFMAGDIETVVAKCVVLAIGIPSAHAMSGLTLADNVITTMYDPSLTENFAQLSKNVASLDRAVTMAIIGSNASAIDALYLIRHSDAIYSRLDRVIVVSPSARLPEPIRAEPVPPPKLDALLRLGPPNRSMRSENILRAVERDAQRLRARGLVATQFARPILMHVFTLLAAVPKLEQNRFMEMSSKYMLRSIASGCSEESLEPVEALKTADKLRLIRGKFYDACVTENRAIHVRYLQSDQKTLQELHVDALIFATGFASFENTNDRLLQNILSDTSLGLRINSSGAGLSIDDTFQASDGIFVLGSLLTGMNTAHGAIFDLETTNRLWDLSRYVASALVDAACSRRQLQD